MLACTYYNIAIYCNVCILQYIAIHVHIYVHTGYTIVMWVWYFFVILVCTYIQHIFVMYAVLVLLESLSITKYAVTRLVTITVAPMFPISGLFQSKEKFAVYLDRSRYIRSRNILWDHVISNPWEVNSNSQVFARCSTTEKANSGFPTLFSL